MSRLLDELENFRAATIQVLNLQIPENYARTQVIIFESNNDFDEVAPIEYVAAYATTIRGVPHIVMPRGGDSRTRESVVRHEFAHVLLHYNGFEYPWWFSEGFAEFMSSVDFRKRNTEFRLGAPPLRASSYYGSTMDWNVLISDGGNSDDEITLQKLSNAYLQSWLLVHHMLLGHELRHVTELAQYFYYTANGEPTHVAFEKAFGVTSQEMGGPLMNSKSTRVDIYTFEFTSSLRDNDFVQSEMSADDVASLLANLRSARRRSAD